MQTYEVTYINGRNRITITVDVQSLDHAVEAVLDEVCAEVLAMLNAHEAGESTEFRFNDKPAIT